MREIIQTNFIGFFICIYILLFVFSDIRTSGGIYKYFLRVALCIFSILLFNSLLSGATSALMKTVFRSLFEFSKVFTLYVLILLALYERKLKVPYLRLILAFPAVCDAVLLGVSFVNGIVFSYGSEGAFIGGALRHATDVLCIIYLIIIFYCAILRGIEGEQNVSTMLMLTVPILVAALIVEYFSGISSFFATMCAVCVEFYYIIIHGNHNCRDQLTGTFNRRKFYLDSRRSTLSGVITIDMNGLKVLNDTRGHAAGDEALVTISERITDALLPFNCSLYRMGGDEFSVLCHRMEEKEIEMLIPKIKNSLAGTPYTVACGYGTFDKRAGLDAACHAADVSMYKNKMEMKKKT